MGKFDFDNKVNEAFRAGNKARKKEAVQDTVESVDDIQAQIDLFKEQAGKSLEIKNGRPYFGYSLYLESNIKLTKLPDGLIIEGTMDLDGCTGLTSLPVGLTVKKGLYLRNCTGLTSLSAGLTVGDGLYLNNCTGLTSLPAGLNVGGLNLENCNGLTSLPADLTISKNGGYICSVPESLRPFFEQFGIKISNYGDVFGQNWMSKRHLVSQMDEAFRAGNKARKKEAVQDTVDAVDSPVKWENQEIGRFMQSRGIVTVKDCADVDDMKMMQLLFGITNLFTADLISGGPMKFNELQLFTGFKSLTWQAAPELTEITLPHTLERIITLSGLDMDLLEIPASVTYISRKAFTGLNARKVKFLGSGRLVLPELVFASNQNIREIESERDLTLEQWAFAQCGRLRSVNAVDITDIDDLVFLDCDDLESVDNLRSTFRIGNYAFSGCEKLRSVSCMSPNLHSVGKCAFANCSSLVTAEINGTDFLDMPFAGCRSLKRLSMPGCGSIQSYLFSTVMDDRATPDGIVIETPENMIDRIRQSLCMLKNYTIVPTAPVSEAFKAGNRARKKESAQNQTADIFSAVPDEPTDLGDFLNKIRTFLKTHSVEQVESKPYMVGVPEGKYVIDLPAKIRRYNDDDPQPEFMMIRPMGCEVFICIDLFGTMASAYVESVEKLKAEDGGTCRQTEQIGRPHFTRSHMYANIDNPKEKWIRFWTVLRAFVSGEFRTVNDLRDYLHNSTMPSEYVPD